MYSTRGLLNLLATGDTFLVFLSSRRSDIVVEGKYVVCASLLPNDLGTLTVVFLNNLLVVVEV
jgi:hypothetical protein